MPPRCLSRHTIVVPDPIHHDELTCAAFSSIADAADARYIPRDCRAFNQRQCAFCRARRYARRSLVKRRCHHKTKQWPTTPPPNATHNAHNCEKVLLFHIFRLFIHPQRC